MEREKVQKIENNNTSNDNASNGQSTHRNQKIALFGMKSYESLETACTSCWSIAATDTVFISTYVDIVYWAQVINARWKEYGDQNESKKLSKTKCSGKKEEMRSNSCTQFGRKERAFVAFKWKTKTKEQNGQKAPRKRERERKKKNLNENSAKQSKSSEHHAEWNQHRNLEINELIALLCENCFGVNKELSERCDARILFIHSSQMTVYFEVMKMCTYCF